MAANAYIESSEPQMCNESKTYKIGELADLLSDTTRTLRYYEELGLLEPLRSESGQRVYSEAAIPRLRLIHELKVGGFSLTEIRDLFQAWNGEKVGGHAAKESLTMLQKKVIEIEELRGRLANLQKELHAMMDFLAACRPCDHKPSIESCSQCQRHGGSHDNSMVTILKKG